MSIKILDVYLKRCNFLGVEPNWEELKELKRHFDKVKTMEII